MDRLAQWMLNHTYTGGKSLSEAQLQQTKARILLTIASLLYIILHGELFEYYKVEALSFAAFYFVMNTTAMLRLRHKPLSITGILFYPILDVMIVTFGMLIDGGHSSGIYFMLLVIIIGNGLRFGNPLLIFSQLACLIGMLGITAYGHHLLSLPIDATLLSWQVFTLIAVPFYVFLIGKKLERAIKDKGQAEQTSFHLIDKGPLPVFTYELDRRDIPKLLYANAAMFKLFQVRQIDIIGHSTDVLVLPEDSDEMLKFCRSAFLSRADEDGHLPMSTYLRGRDKSGRIVKLMATAIRMRWRERMIGICFLLDVTERETLQEELETVYKEGYMSTLVAGIVHDFRNVLTNMIGNAEVLQMSSQSEEEKQQAEAIIAAGERGSELITHLLKLSRSGNNRDHAKTYTRGESLPQPLENILGLARLQLPRNIRLVSAIDECLPDVDVNAVEIEQILLNLINNSMQAIAHNGTIEVNIGRHVNPDSGSEDFCITVIDNGEGISEEDLEKVFKPFWTSRGENGGTGIGLTMVQRIVKLHHGRIGITSPPGERRTTVQICIPPRKTEQDDSGDEQVPEAHKQSSETAKAVTVENQHILLVDDMPDILKIHQAILTRMGHTTELAESADKALELFRKNESPFDLIITDFRMPGKDGLKLVEEIREIDRNIPILMVTAYGEDEQLQRVGGYGVLLINKPVTIEKMKASIVEAVSSD